MSTVTDGSCPVVGLVEIAEAFGVQRATVDQWRIRGVLPDPPWRVGGRPAWPRAVIDELAASGRRIAHPDGGVDRASVMRRLSR